MKLHLNRMILVACSTVALLLSGCGGSNSSSSAGPTGGGGGVSVTPPATLSGTAAVGQPITGSVFAIDVNGKSSPAVTTSAAGAFVVDVSGMTAPYFLSITGVAGGKQVTLNSIATTNGQTVNLTPLTDLILSISSGQPSGSSFATLCTPVANVVAPACLSALANAATPAKLDAAVSAVTSIISPLNAAGTNPLTGTFAANGTGFDALLDQILVTPAAAQSAMATVTLISTNTTLGQATLPAAAGLATVIASVPALTTSELAKAAAAATVMPEIRACLTSFNALYAKAAFSAPSQATVMTYFASSFALGRLEDQGAIATALSGANAVPGFALASVGFSPYDMSPLTAGEIASTGFQNGSQTVVDIIKARTASAIAFNASNAPTAAWIQMRADSSASLVSWKFVKESAYTGCPGGWKMAGTQHVDMHMDARIQRSLNGASAATFTRLRAFHVGVDGLGEETAAGSAKIDEVTVRGPGLSVYSGNASAPVGAAQAVKLRLPLAALGAYFRIVDSTGFYGEGEALQSCQDLASTSAPAGAPCIDETAVAPGKLYSWVLKKGVYTTPAAPGVVAAFPYQINSVPLSKAFTIANQNALFATVTSVTPSGISALNTALAAFAGPVLDNLFTITYTQSATYGSRMDNCGLGLYIGATAVLRAEADAVGAETSCTFNTARLNSGSLAKPGGTIQNGFIGVTTTVLGNQASSSQSY